MLFETKIIFQLKDINQYFRRLSLYSVLFYKIKLLNDLLNFLGYFFLNLDFLNFILDTQNIDK